jgi:hypothetical protein
MAQQVAKVVIKGLIAGVVETRNIFYYGRDAANPPSTQAFSDITNFLNTQVFGMLQDFLASQFALYSAAWYYRDVEGHWIPNGETGLSLSGGAEIEFSAYQIAGLMGAATSVLKARGRKFIPGLAESATALGRLTLAAAGAFLQAAIAYITPVNSGFPNEVWVPGIVSKSAIFAPFTSSYVGAILSTIRRRKPGYGI